MSKNPEDEELVTKGAVKDRVWQKTMFHRDIGDVVDRDGICDAIDKLPAVLPNSRQARKIKSPEQIEKAIKKLDEIPVYPTPLYTIQDITDFGRWILGQEQKEKGLHWMDKELLG